MVDTPRYHPAALDSALALVARATSADTARVVAGIIRARGGASARAVDLRVLADARNVGAGDLDALRQRFREANREFRNAFGSSVFEPDLFVSDRSAPESFGEEEDGETRPGDQDSGGTHLTRLAANFTDVLDHPAPAIVAVDAPEPDPSTASWITIAVACLASGRGHHLVLRCRDRGPREPADVARLAVSRGACVVRLAADGVDSVELAVLRAELHAHAVPALVVMDRELVSEAAAEDEDDRDRPVVATAPKGRLSKMEESRLRLLRDVRNTYVWRAPADLVVDAGLAGFLGGAIGPFEPTRQWRDAVVANMAPGLGAVGTRALVSRVADPREAAAIAATSVVAASALAIDLDEAAVFVAGSLSGVRPAMPTMPADFDARLVVCDDEGQLLLARAQELARHGGRVLFFGPPGGGKTTFAQALAAAMGRGAQTLTGAAILARHWGVTERLISEIWSRAADDGTTLIIDELDSLCGVRDPGEAGASSGNAYLIRTLTNEFLRAFDTYGSIPVIATANHLEAIDDAVRRRFTFVVNVRGELTPEAEALAWRSVFDVDPPPGWAPIGANISDFANAARRCRMLGLLDAESLAAAVERSREARLGPSANGRRARGRLQ